MRTLPADAAAQIAATFRQGVALAHLTASEPGRGDTLYRWGSQALTLSGNVYADVFARKPSLGWRTTKAHGGLATEADCTLYLRNESGLAASVLSNYYPGGDAFELFLLFLTGSETSASLVRIFTGVAGVPEYNGREWELRCTGNAQADFREVPLQRVNLKSHPYAQRDAVGKVIPWIVGNWQAAELIDEQYVFDLYPLHLVDKFQGIYLGGVQMSALSAFYLQYPQSEKLALVRGTSYTADPVAGTLTLTGTERSIYCHPALPQSTNTVATWHRAANRVLTSGAALADGDSLDLFMEEVPRLGEAFSAALEILVEDNAAEYDVTLLRYNQAAYAATGLTGDLSVPLLGLDQAVTTISGTTSFSTDRTDQGIVEIESGTTITVNAGIIWTVLNGENFADTWGGWVVQIAGHGDKEVYQVAIVIHFDEQQTGDLTSLKAFAAGLGRVGEANLIDGSAIVSGPLYKGVNQLHYLFRARDGFAHPASRMDAASFTEAAGGVRQHWRTKVALLEAQDPERLVDEWAYALGAHLIFTLDEDWRLVPRDVDTAPVHLFRRSTMSARRVDAQTGTILEHGPDARSAQIGADNALNDISLRYGYYAPTGDFQAVEERTARWWATGTASVEGTTLTDPDADFVAAQVAVGHTAVLGGQEHAVEAVTTTTLTLTPGAGTVAAVDYWVGPNLTAALVHSRRRYGQENTLTRSGGGARAGGLTARYVDYAFDADAEGQRPAERFVNYGAQWFSQAWTVQEIAGPMRTLALELGDVVLLDDSGLPDPKRPRAHGAVAEALDASETVWDVGTGQGYNYQAGEYLLIDDEAVVVESIAADAITVSRARAGTTAAEHDEATVLYLLPVTWEISGWKPDLETWTLRYRLQERPAAVASYWLEETTRTLSADESLWGPLAVAPGTVVTVASGQTLTVLDR